MRDIGRLVHLLRNTLVRERRPGRRGRAAGGRADLRPAGDVESGSKRKEQDEANEDILSE